MYAFIMEITGFGYATDEQIIDSLFGAGLDDALVCGSGNRLFLDITREASSFAHAVASATADVRCAGFDVVSVRPVEDDQ